MGNESSSCEPCATCIYPIQCFNQCPKEIQRKNNRKNMKNIQIMVSYYEYDQKKWMYFIEDFKNVSKYLKWSIGRSFSSSSSIPDQIIKDFVKTIYEQNSLNVEKYEIKDYNDKFYIINIELKN